MRILYYASITHLERVLAVLPDLGRRVELHVLLELTPESWSSDLFDVPPRPLRSGVLSAEPVLHNYLPESLRRYWQPCADVRLLVFNCRRSLHPSTFRVSYNAARLVRALRPDVIHMDDTSLRIAPTIWLWRKIPVVLTTHDPEPHSGEGNWRIELSRRLTFPFTNRFILFNETGSRAFVERYGISPERVEAVRLGVHGMSREWEHEVAAEEELTVLFFGRLSAYKGLEVLYEAAPLVSRIVENVRFIVAGRPERGYTPPPPPQLSNGGQMELLERYLHNAEASRLFERAAFLVCPYVDATQSAVILTAFGFGKPVVATRVGGIPEYVDDGETGLLVPPRDGKALANAITRLLQDRLMRERLKANVQKKVATELSWSDVAERFTGVYERAIRTFR